MTLVSLTPADMVAAWKRGDIDAGYVWGPFSHTMEGDGGKQILATEQLAEEWLLRLERLCRAQGVRRQISGDRRQVPADVPADTWTCTTRTRKAMVKLVAQALEPERGCSARHAWPACTFRRSRSSCRTSCWAKAAASHPAMLDTARFLVELGDLKQSEVPPSFKPFINTQLYGARSPLTDAQGAQPRALIVCLYLHQ